MSSEYEVTMHSISIMYVKLFEKLGWMIIANSNKDKEKTKMYLHTLKQVKKIIDNKEALIFAYMGLLRFNNKIN